MPIYDTSDISDESIKGTILEVNSLYSEIIRRLFNTVDIETKKRLQGTVSACCSAEDLQLLTRLIRIFIENYRSRNNNRLPLSYATFAILYYYYQLELIETNVTTFLDLGTLKVLYNVPPQYIAGIHVLSNFLITSDEPYVVEIRKSILKLNEEPFVGGRRRRNGSRRRKINKKRAIKKRKTRRRV